MRVLIVCFARKLFQPLLAMLCICCAAATYAVDSFDGKYLAIPQVLVGSTTYSNVVITVGSIVSLGSGTPAASYDIYDAAKNQLNIASVQYVGITYTNVKVTVGLVVSVNGVGSNSEVSGVVTLGASAQPLAGVVVALSSGATVTTDVNGKYTFTGLTMSQSYTLTPSLNGYAFSPATLTLKVSAPGTSGENFAATAIQTGGCPIVAGAKSGKIDPSPFAAVFSVSATSLDYLYSFPGATFTPTAGSTTVKFSAGSSLEAIDNSVLTGIASTGPQCGLGGITSIPTAGYQTSLPLQQGYGYVGQIGDGTYVRLYVASIGAGPVFNVQYEYPATICPANSVLKYVGVTEKNFASATFNNIVSNSPGYGSPTRYPFFGCAGTATIQVWGGGGGGGASIYGGGGGGGGGGYVSQTINLVPGQWYVVQVGHGGGTFGFSPGSSGTSSSFSIEAGNSILTATGGKGGGYANSSTAIGVGGQPGSGSSNDTSSPHVEMPGIAGGNGGLANLCSGLGSAGPAGTGGAGGNGGNGGKGGCSPGPAGAPGGGGSGGSDGTLGEGAVGGTGQVIISW